MQDVKGEAESVKAGDEEQKGKEEAAAADGAERAQEDVDISLGNYREKLYIEVSLMKACIIVLVFFL